MRIPLVPGRVADRLPSRPLVAARRVAAGIGLEQVVRLERAVDAVEEAAAENAALAVGLDQRVTELERSLVGPLEARRRWQSDRDDVGHDPDEPDEDAAQDEPDEDAGDPDDDDDDEDDGSVA